MTFVKPSKSKAQERSELAHQIDDFLNHGGQVTPVPQGTSGREIGSYRIPPVAFNEPRESRTLLTDEVKAIEARKSRHGSVIKPKKRRPKRVLIKDDFGEPIRWSWEES